MTKTMACSLVQKYCKYTRRTISYDNQRAKKACHSPIIGRGSSSFRISEFLRLGLVIFSDFSCGRQSRRDRLSVPSGATASHHIISIVCLSTGTSWQKGLPHPQIPARPEKLFLSENLLAIKMQGSRIKISYAKLKIPAPIIFYWSEICCLSEYCNSQLSLRLLS